MRNLEQKMETRFRTFNTLMPAPMPSLTFPEVGSLGLGPNLHMSSLHGPSLHDPTLSLTASPLHGSSLSSSSMAVNLPPLPSHNLMNELKLENPYTTDAQGNKQLSLQFDVRKFQPEDIKVETEGNHLRVHAKHEEKSEGKHSSMTFQRTYTLPMDIEGESMTSVLSPEGVLTIEAPVKPANQQAITHQ